MRYLNRKGPPPMSCSPRGCVLVRQSVHERISSWWHRASAHGQHPWRVRSWENFPETLLRHAHVLVVRRSLRASGMHSLICRRGRSRGPSSLWRPEDSHGIPLATRQQQPAHADYGILFMSLLSQREGTQRAQDGTLAPQSGRSERPSRLRARPLLMFFLEASELCAPSASR